MQFYQEKIMGNMFSHNALFLLMSVFSQTFFALVGCHLMSFSLFSAWHGLSFSYIKYYSSSGVTP